jgi:adenylylsulfate kinase
VVVLELDALRKTLTPEPTYSDTEREIVYRTLVYVARLLTACGRPVVIDATAHRRAWRDLARASIARFAEVQLACPLPVLRERERTRQAVHAPKGIYAAADRPGATVPGVNVPYEEALAPELRIDTSVEDVAAAAARVAELAAGLGRSAPAAAEPPRPGGAVWLTGLPGSGKSTLACIVADRLQARGVRVSLLGLADLQDFVLAGRLPRPPEEEIVHRALVAAAQALTGAGIPVVIDATAPRRAWREMARTCIVHFAEVQLHCPPDICGHRERAARWNLVLCPQATWRRPPADAAPNIVLQYEHSLSPDLTVATDVQGPDAAAEPVVQLAERLHRSAERRRDEEERHARP